MAEIYLARREGIEDFTKKVVLKRIRPELAGDPRFVRMFLDEARLAATLTHHNIAQVYDIGEDGEAFFFAMEHLDGIDTRTLLRWAMATEPIPLRVALAIVLATASALHYAHGAKGTDGAPLGIVHRDISPSNIFITFDGAIKLMDFGIAKARFKEGRTASGTLKGKAPYMAPEQIHGEDSDHRSDIFSLGVVLYELATTSRLFRGKTEFQIFRQIVSGKPPSPRDLKSHVPDPIARVIAKCLERVPDRRYDSVLEMRRALDEFAAQSGLRADELEIAEYVRRCVAEKPEASLETPTNAGSIEGTGERQTRRLAVVGGALATAALLAGGALLLARRRTADNAPTGTRETVPASATLTPTRAASPPPPDAGPDAASLALEPPPKPDEPAPKGTGTKSRSRRKDGGDRGKKESAKPAWDPNSPLPPPAKKDKR